MGDLVLRQDTNGVATLTLNRPDKLNALNVALFKQLLDHVETLAQQTLDVGCVVIIGAGKCFSAGHDLGDIAEGEKLPMPNFQSHVIEKLANLPQPVISAVRSHCYTGALELALAGDLIIAAEDAKFADTHAKWALTPVWGLSQRLPRRVGKNKAMEMMLTTRNYLADEAAQIGLANSVLSNEDFSQQVQLYAEKILENSWFSLRANKRLLLQTDGLDLASGLAQEIYHSPGRGPDMEQRIAQFGKKK